MGKFGSVYDLLVLKFSTDHVNYSFTEEEQKQLQSMYDPESYCIAEDIVLNTSIYYPNHNTEKIQKEKSYFFSISELKRNTKKAHLTVYAHDKKSSIIITERTYDNISNFIDSGILKPEFADTLKAIGLQCRIVSQYVKTTDVTQIDVFIKPNEDEVN